MERFDNSQGLSRFNVEVKHDLSLFSDNCIVIFAGNFMTKGVLKFHFVYSL